MKMLQASLCHSLLLENMPPQSQISQHESILYRPDYILQLADCDVVRDEELGLVQDGQLLLAMVPFNDDGHLGGVLLPDLLHVLHAES